MLDKRVCPQPTFLFNDSHELDTSNGMFYTYDRLYCIDSIWPVALIAGILIDTKCTG
jgi:hypothetical protein